MLLRIGDEIAQAAADGCSLRFFAKSKKFHAKRSHLPHSPRTLFVPTIIEIRTETCLRSMFESKILSLVRFWKAKTTVLKGKLFPKFDTQDEICGEETTKKRYSLFLAP